MLNTFFFRSLVLCFLYLSACSCNREVEDRLPGQWNYNESGTKTVIYNGTTTTEEYTNTGTMTFVDDGSGTKTHNNISTSFTWITVPDSVKITFEEQALNFFVKENDKEIQEWETTFAEEGEGYSFTTETSLTLTQ